MLGLAKRVGARFSKISPFISLSLLLVLYLLIYFIFNRILLTSTSEVYGDPLVHPQTEDYWGNVNPIGNVVFLRVENIHSDNSKYFYCGQFIWKTDEL